MEDLREVLETMTMSRVGDSHFEGGNLQKDAGAVVFGGQLLAQTILVLSQAITDKHILNLHTTFARSALADDPVNIDVDGLRDGRTFSTAAATVKQNGEFCAQSLALMHKPEPDLIRHQEFAPRFNDCDYSKSVTSGGWWDARVSPDVELLAPTAIGPPSLQLHVRFPGAPADDVAVNQALLAYASDGFLIATAMRPHKGIGQDLAHREISTTVLSHTLVFHEPFCASDGLVIDHVSSYAGRGRTQGRANVFDAHGTLVASFSQTNMVRAFPDGSAPSPGAVARH